jgi:hypothetical protein
VLEQNYRADPISESLLLSLNEGKTIDFLVQRENKQEVVTGKIIRSGYTPHNYMASREKDWGSRSFITQETLEIAGGGARATQSLTLPAAGATLPYTSHAWTSSGAETG